MKIAMIGTGYVGLVSGACLADVGCDVTCIDIDEAKVNSLRRGSVPIYEPGLQDLVERGVEGGRLRFTTDTRSGIRGADAIFIAVGTPSSPKGPGADLTAVESAARSIGQTLEDYCVVVMKSTVPVGTGAIVSAIIQGELDRRCVAVEFDIADNPEFLKEGEAIADFMKPDRIVIGTNSERAKDLLARVYRPFVLNGHPIHFMDVASAELTKYAANAMLAMRISFMNVIAQLCDGVGADVAAVRRGIASDPRIGPQFLYSGVGYGGSCFPKDVRALVAMGESLGLSMDLIRDIDTVNERQKMIAVDRLEVLLGSFEGTRIAVWGLAFKPNTDDVRESAAVAIVNELLRRGADVRVFDPVAMEAASPDLDTRCELAESAYDTLDDADALLLVTEWPEFRNPDAAEIAKRMRGRIVLDGRNVLDRLRLAEHGLEYYGIGTRGDAAKTSEPSRAATPRDTTTNRYAE